MPTTVRCPQCGHVLLSIDLPERLTPLSSNAMAPDARLLLRVAEAAPLLGVSRSSMYELVASGQVPVLRLGRSMASKCKAVG